MEASQVKAAIAVPIIFEDEVLGFIAFDDGKLQEKYGKTIQEGNIGNTTSLISQFTGLGFLCTKRE